MPEQYSEEQVKKILVQAMNQSDQSWFSRTQLEEMATELGISAITLKQVIDSMPPNPADRRYPTRHLEQSVPLATPRSTRASSNTGFYIHLKVYIAVNTFLLLLNFTLAGTITWAIYPILGWGLGVALHPVRRKSSRSSHESL